MTQHPEQRRVAMVPRAGGPDVLEVRDDALDVLKPGDVLVRVEAAGLNHVESLVRSGAYAAHIPFPYAAGFEGAGVVVAAGPDVEVPLGARVCWTAVFGSCATFVVAPATMLARLPDDLSFEDGASLAHAGVTAAGLVRHWPTPKGSFALVWGAAGSVGQALVARLAEHGVTVIGVASGPRIEAARAAGAAVVIDRSREDVGEAVRTATGGRGVSVVFDPVGAATYRASLGALAPRGCLVSYGQLSGPLPAVDLVALMDAGSVFVTKYGPGAGLIGRDDVGPVVAEALKMASTRGLTSGTPVRFALDQVIEAYACLDTQPQGKVLLLPHAT